MPPAPSPSTDQTSPPPSISHQNQTSIAAWNANALFWDAYMGDAGNEFYQLLELPALQRLVDPQPNEHILDLATGNGLVARWLANHGAIVTATDAAEAMLETARKRTTTPDEANRITYEVLDVTNETELAEMIARAEKHGRFNAITMNMAIMDIPTLAPLAAALPELLTQHGRFIATITHPVFFQSGASRHIDIGDHPTTGRFHVSHSVNIQRYLDVPPAQGEALHQQPVPQMYFHRPMHALFAPFFQAGLVLDGLEERAFADGPDAKKIHSYSNFPQIPLVLAFRLRKAG